MNYSLNEIYVMGNLAAGLAGVLAEEACMAVRRLSAYGLPAQESLANLLPGKDALSAVAGAIFSQRRSRVYVKRRRQPPRIRWIAHLPPANLNAVPTKKQVAMSILSHGKYSANLLAARSRRQRIPRD